MYYLILIDITENEAIFHYKKLNDTHSVTLNSCKSDKNRNIKQLQLKNINNGLLLNYNNDKFKTNQYKSLKYINL